MNVPMYCTECGQQFGATEKFCPNCGSPRQPTPPPPAPVSTGVVVEERLAAPSGPPVTLPPPVQTRAASHRRVPPTVRWIDIAGPIRDAVAVTLVGALLAFISVAVLALLLLDGDRGSIGDWAWAAISLIAAALGQSIGLQDVSTDGALVVIHFTPLLVTFLLLAPLVMLARRRAHRDTPSLVTTSVMAIATGLTVAVTIVILRLLSSGRVTLGDGSSADILNPSPTDFLVTWLLVTLTCLVGQWSLVPTPSWLPGHVRSALDTAFASLRAFLLAYVLIGTLVIFTVTAIAVIRPDPYVGAEPPAADWSANSTIDEAGGVALAIIWMLLLLPNLLVLLFGFGSGGTLSAVSTSGGLEEFGFSLNDEFSVGLFVGTSWTRVLPFVAVVLLAILVAGVRVAVRRDRDANLMPAWWLSGLTFAIFSLLLLVLTRFDITATTSGTESVSFTVGLGLGSVVASSLAIGALTLTCAAFVAKPFALTFPRTAARLGGRRLHPSWASVVTIHKGDAAPSSRGVMPRIVGISILAGAAAVFGLFAFRAVAERVIFTIATPEATAQEFADEISARDIEGAGEALGENRGLEPLPASALDSALPQGEASVSDESDWQPGRLDAEYSMEITDGEDEFDQQFALDAQVNEWLGWVRYPSWNVSADLPVMSVEADYVLDDVTVAGQSVEDGDYLALPGSYVVAGTSQSAFVTDLDTTETLDLGEDVTVRPAAGSIPYQAKADAEDVARAALNNCLDAASGLDAPCADKQPALQKGESWECCRILRWFKYQGTTYKWSAGSLKEVDTQIVDNESAYVTYTAPLRVEKEANYYYDYNGLLPTDYDSKIWRGSTTGQFTVLVREVKPGQFVATLREPGDV